MNIIYKLAPRNPNVNGYYYDEISYNNALEEYKKEKFKPLFSSYDEIKEIIGNIYKIDNNDVYCNIFEDTLYYKDYLKDNITDFVVGFFLPIKSKIDSKTFIIDRIQYSVLINKNDIKDFLTDEYEAKVVLN